MPETLKLQRIGESGENIIEFESATKKISQKFPRKN